ncbi:pyridoxal phosphate-dependent decarboxylase family protein [Gilvibacter sp.]|uniref:pyridoxal phosphate-dependent decarboxylase family protein n=1 Tax=Gilvibacter sp. TaxID=2729997 RepID=UPI0035BE189F
MQQELDLFRRIADRLLSEEKREGVVKPIPAAALWNTLNLQLSAEGLSETEFEQLLTEVVLSTPRTATSKFFNQLFGGRTPKATLGDLLAVMLNNSMYTYKVAGPQVGVEKAIIKEIISLIGYPSTADGTIASGGSMSNLIAMLMARDKKDPEARFKGNRKPLVAYTSAASHYSIAKNAAFLGIGRDYVRNIPTDATGKMDPQALSAQILSDKAAGLEPFFINGTAGTTVLGVFDPIDPLADIAQAHELWLHIDGAYCGSVVFSTKYKHLVSGLHRADSFNLNAHKMMGTPLTCSIIVTRHKKHLADSLSNEAEYLYQTDGDDFNLGKTSLQCGRRNDALKFWSLWKAVGTKGLEAMVDRQFALAETAVNYIRDHKDYTLYSDLPSISVCFNYKDIPAKTLCTALYEEGELMVGFGSFANETFVRLVTINAGNQEQQILDFFATMEAFVSKHEAALKITTEV